MTTISKWIKTYSFLLLTLILLMVINDNFSAMPDILFPVLKIFSFSIFLVNIIIGLYFNKSSVIYISIMMLLYNVFNSYNWFVESGQVDANMIMLALIALNIILFSFCEDKGVDYFWIIFILAQYLLVYFLISEYPKVALNFVAKEIDFFKGDKFGNVPDVSKVAFGITILFFILKKALYRATNDVIYFFVTITIFLSVYFHSQYSFLLFFSFAGILLTWIVFLKSYSIAYIDELTQIPGRTALNEQLNKLNNRYCIAMVDIDHFKKFNDTYGHDIGDEVLKLVAGVLKDVGKKGKSYRYGGEEFTIVFPQKNSDEVLEALDKLRERVENTPYLHKKVKINKKEKKKQIMVKKLFVTISVGVADKTKKTKKPEEVIKNADNALYKSKDKGRNCVTQF